jgi:serine phosphatase RsbU (regulator of sigma subunit)
MEMGSVKLTEIKADKRPIGAYDGENIFTEHQVKLSKGDTIYVFSDGYADQFGGENNKKMKSGKFKKILAESYPQLMDDQRETLKKAFDEWKGDYEQIDDVCVIGYRFEG